MAVNDEYLAWVLEQLGGAGRVSTRRMFGAVGLYCNDVFFAIISADTLYFKVNDDNRAHYATRRMEAFRPARQPHVSMSYFEVPADVLEDADECVAWARRAITAGRVKSSSKKKSKK